jgi:hypothetical protein
MNLNKSKSTKTTQNIYLFVYSFREQINRRHYSKSESLLVSLLKQEAITEKQDIPSSKIASIMMSQPVVSIKRNKTVNETFSNEIQIKLEKNDDDDFIIKKQKLTKKTTNKNQVVIY